MSMSTNRDDAALSSSSEQQPQLPPHPAAMDLPILRLPVDPVKSHRAHPDRTECHSLECLRAHCLHLETLRTTEDIICTPTSPFSGSPRSTRSGTSPGYANDWADRQERLVIQSNQPTKERIAQTVKQLAPMTHGQRVERKEADAPSRSQASDLAPVSASVSSDRVASGPQTSVPLPLSTLPTSKLLQRRQMARQHQHQQQQQQGDNS